MDFSDLENGELIHHILPVVTLTITLKDEVIFNNLIVDKWFLLDNQKKSLIRILYDNYKTNELTIDLQMFSYFKRGSFKLLFQCLSETKISWGEQFVIDEVIQLADYFLLEPRSPNSIFNRFLRNLIQQECRLLLHKMKFKDHFTKRTIIGNSTIIPVNVTLSFKINKKVIDLLNFKDCQRLITSIFVEEIKPIRLGLNLKLSTLAYHCLNNIKWLNCEYVVKKYNIHVNPCTLWICHDKNPLLEKSLKWHKFEKYLIVRLPDKIHDTLNSGGDLILKQWSNAKDYMEYTKFSWIFIDSREIKTVKFTPTVNDLVSVFYLIYPISLIPKKESTINSITYPFMDIVDPERLSYSMLINSNLLNLWIDEDNRSYFYNTVVFFEPSFTFMLDEHNIPYIKCYFDLCNEEIVYCLPVNVKKFTPPNTMVKYKLYDICLEYYLVNQFFDIFSMTREDFIRDDSHEIHVYEVHNVEEEIVSTKAILCRQGILVYPSGGIKIANAINC